jgi:hypothetical protein
MASAVSPVSASNGVDALCSVPARDGEEDETGRSRGQLGACALVSMSPELGHGSGRSTWWMEAVCALE